MQYNSSYEEQNVEQQTSKCYVNDSKNRNPNTWRPNNKDDPISMTNSTQF